MIDQEPPPPDIDAPPALAVVQSSHAPVYGPPPPPPPTYEYEVEPQVYLVGHTLCLLFSLGALWLLLQSPITPHHLEAALIAWAILAGCMFWMIQGVRYGCRVRLYKGYIELRMLCPTRMLAAGEVAYFREFYRDKRSLRRICLYLRSGERVLLPRVHDPEMLRRGLLDDVGLEQAIM